MATETIVDYKRLSHDGSKARGSEVLDARAKVSHRVKGTMKNITPAGETPPLLAPKSRPDNPMDEITAILISGPKVASHD